MEDGNKVIVMSDYACGLKLIRVIESCKHPKQLRGAATYMELFEKRFSGFEYADSKWLYWILVNAKNVYNIKQVELKQQMQ